ncbi:MAG TPA: hypothetical protein VKF59_22335 [Candidatus Dormibacteraeota bacterium]|nr:hypothetical protein [Candidatus Dormibacteraeota bacterium]
MGNALVLHSWVVAMSRSGDTAAGSLGPGLRNPYSVLPDWLYPTFVVVALSAFSLYAAWVVLFFPNGRAGPYLSPFTSPEIHVTVAGFAIPTGIWIFWVPLLFRATCYYYRKALFRGFLGDPRSCAASEGRGGPYHGETRLLVFNNLHRFIFYLTTAQVVVLWYDTIAAFVYQGAPHLGIGNALMLVNVVCLSAYTFGCHAFRHLAGGGLDCFSCHRARYQLWRGVTVLNVRHDRWAWVSMFTVWGVDLYIRLLILGVIPAAAWV